MSKKCPHCGGELSPPRVPKPKGKRRVCYINAFGKPVYYSKLMNDIMDARERDEITPGYDWFPAYLANIPRALELQKRIMAPRPDWIEGEESEARQARLDVWEKDVKAAELENLKAIRKVFRSGNWRKDDVSCKAKI